MEVKIDPEFKSLIPAISDEELKALEESLLNEGCRDPLVLWDDILLDGHNRFEICTRHDIKFKTIVKGFDDREQAKLWIIGNQLARRNLSPDQMSHLRGLKYQLEKKELGHPQKECDQNDHKAERTAEKLAKEFNVSPATIRRDAKFAEAVDKLPAEEKKEVLGGKSKKSKREIVQEAQLQKKIPRLGPPRNGMLFARLAIMDLEKIQKDDLERDQAYKAIEKWMEENIPIEGPIKYKKYIERLSRAWKIIPKRPLDFNDGQRMKVESYAGQFFFLLEPYIKVRPSEDFITRVRNLKSEKKQKAPPGKSFSKSKKNLI